MGDCLYVFLYEYLIWAFMSLYLFVYLYLRVLVFDDRVHLLVNLCLNICLSICFSL